MYITMCLEPWGGGAGRRLYHGLPTSSGNTLEIHIFRLPSNPKHHSWGRGAASSTVGFTSPAEDPHGLK